MSTPTPPGDVSVTAPGCPACGQPLPAGRSRRFCSAACRRPPTVDATKGLHLLPSCRRAGHGCKAPSTNAQNAIPAT